MRRRQPRAPAAPSVVRCNTASPMPMSRYLHRPRAPARPSPLAVRCSIASPTSMRRHYHWPHAVAAPSSPVVRCSTAFLHVDVSPSLLSSRCTAAIYELHQSTNSTTSSSSFTTAPHSKCASSVLELHHHLPHVDVLSSLPSSRCVTTVCELHHHRCPQASAPCHARGAPLPPPRRCVAVSRELQQHRDYRP